MAKKKEPTLGQLYDLVGKKFDQVDKKFEMIFSQLQRMQHDIRHVQVHLKEHDGRFDEIDVVLSALSRALDKDAMTIVEYGRRIARLERSR